MGIYPQPNLWQCGPFALKHALIALGVFADEKTISKVSGANWRSGTDEDQLGKAARRFNCKLLMVRRHDPEVARRELVEYLRKGIPALLCIYDWGHWVTVVKEERGNFILLDSRDSAVLTIVSWRQLKKRWVYRETDELDRGYQRTIYDFHPILPRFRVQTKAKFSIARAKFLRRKENRTLSRFWDDYVTDMLNLCKPRTARSEQVFSLGEFFRRHEAMIVEQVSFWHGWINDRKARKLLDRMHFVADTYGLVIHREDEKRVIAGITALLSLWAAGKFGVQPVYESAGKKKRK
ncbi:MAG: hypothetical protein WBD36_03835 [Bacteroidota bacterium]